MPPDLPPDKDSPDSPSPKPSLLPIANLLSPSEIESLRQEFRLAREQMKLMIAEKRKNRGEVKEANPDDSNR
jgi:hypothetical protein